MLLVNTFTGQSLSTFLLHGTLCTPGSRISDSPSLRHDNNILSTDNAIFPGQRGTEETKRVVATLSRLFSISSYRGCSVFLRRSAEFKGMKYRSFYFFFFPSPRPSDYRPRLSAPFRFRRVFETVRDQILSINVRLLVRYSIPDSGVRSTFSRSNAGNKNRGWKKTKVAWPEKWKGWPIYRGGKTTVY